MLSYNSFIAILSYFKHVWINLICRNRLLFHGVLNYWQLFVGFNQTTCSKSSNSFFQLPSDDLITCANGPIKEWLSVQKEAADELKINVGSSSSFDTRFSQPWRVFTRCQQQAASIQFNDHRFNPRNYVHEINWSDSRVPSPVELSLSNQRFIAIPTTRYVNALCSAVWKRKTATAKHTLRS